MLVRVVSERFELARTARVRVIESRLYQPFCTFPHKNSRTDVLVLIERKSNLPQPPQQAALLSPFLDENIARKMRKIRISNATCSLSVSV